MNDNEIKETEKYVVIDTQTGRVVYTTTYKHRNRARRYRDKKDLEYGACRYICRLVPTED